MSEAIAAMWKDVGLNAVVEVVEYSVRAQKNRDKTFKGLWWSDPTSTLRDPDGMMWRLLAPERPAGLLAAPGVGRAGQRRALLARREVPRRGVPQDDEDHARAQAFGWVIVMQPYEDYGLQKFVDFTPNPNQQFEVRRFNLKLRRA